MSAVVRRSGAPAHDAERANHRLPSGHTCGQESQHQPVVRSRWPNGVVERRHTGERAGEGALMRDVSQRHRGRPVNHEVVGDRFAIVFHLRAQNPLAHEVGGAHHKQRHDHAHDGPDGAVRRRRRLLGRV